MLILVRALCQPSGLLDLTVDLAYTHNRLVADSNPAEPTCPSTKSIFLLIPFLDE